MICSSENRFRFSFRLLSKGRILAPSGNIAGVTRAPELFEPAEQVLFLGLVPRGSPWKRLREQYSACQLQNLSVCQPKKGLQHVRPEGAGELEHAPSAAAQAKCKAPSAIGAGRLPARAASKVEPGTLFFWNSHLK